MSLAAIRAFISRLTSNPRLLLFLACAFFAQSIIRVRASSTAAIAMLTILHGVKSALSTTHVSDDVILFL